MNKEQSAAWRLWQQNPCWQDFLTIVDDIKEMSIKNEDSISTDSLNVAVIAENRGVRKGLNTLLRRIDEITGS